MVNSRKRSRFTHPNGRNQRLRDSWYRRAKILCLRVQRKDSSRNRKTNQPKLERDKQMTPSPPPITQLEMSEADIAFAEKIAKGLGYTQTAYTSTSLFWGVFCLPDHARHKHGCIIKTQECGFLFVSDLEDLQLRELSKEERAPKPGQPKTNSNCDGDKCQAAGEVRTLPVDGQSNAILCRTCFDKELIYRAKRNSKELYDSCKFDLPGWETLKIQTA